LLERPILDELTGVLMRAAHPTGRFVTMPEAQIPVSGEADVVVAGGGPAGAVAALAATRTGARTILVERGPFLGGTATGAMVASFMGFYWRDVLVGGGIGLEITKRLIEAGGATAFTPYVLAEASENPVKVRTFPFDPEILKLVLDDMMSEAGVDVRLHSHAAAPVVEEGAARGLVVQGMSEMEAIRASMVIDASAGATLCRAAGGELSNDAVSPDDLQPMTMMARLSQVDMSVFRALDRSEKRRLARLGVATGELAQQLLSVVSSPHGSDAFILMTRVSGWDGSDSRQLSRAEAIGRAQVRSVMAFLRREVPGFADCSLSSIAPWIGVRETRRAVGEYTLDRAAVESGSQFPDSIAQGGGPMDVHDPHGTGLVLREPERPFAVPLRSLLPSGTRNLMVAGRCLSADREAMGAVRHMGTAMATGHAAGVASALAARSACDVRQVPVHEIQDELRHQQAIVDQPVAAAIA
jgi:hypothetical protein